VTATIDPLAGTPFAGDARAIVVNAISTDAVGNLYYAVITAGGTVNLGNDPDFNSPVRFRGPDLMDSAPVIAPNGDRSIGGYDGGFSFGGDYDGRGAGVVFHRDGSFAAKNEEFWWEVTPTVWRHDGTFSYLQDRQLYSDLELSVGQYAPGQDLETISTIPLDLDPVAIDFLDAHIVFGPGGDRYAVNGNGHLYKFAAGSELPVDAVELPNADGSLGMEGLSSYFARDRAGRIYVSFAGQVTVIGSDGAASTSAGEAHVRVAASRVTAPEGRARLAAGAAAKRAASRAFTPPLPPQ
jgi:hypothetical protein